MITQKRLLEILEKSDGQDKASFYCDMLLSILIVLNLIAISLESVESIGLRYSSFFFVFDERSQVWNPLSVRRRLKCWFLPNKGTNQTLAPTTSGTASRLTNAFCKSLDPYYDLRVVAN